MAVRIRVTEPLVLLFRTVPAPSRPGLGGWAEYVIATALMFPRRTLNHVGRQENIEDRSEKLEQIQVKWEFDPLKRSRPSRKFLVRRAFLGRVGPALPVLELQTAFTGPRRQDAPPGTRAFSSGTRLQQQHRAGHGRLPCRGGGLKSPGRLKLDKKAPCRAVGGAAASSRTRPLTLFTVHTTTS
jgi:hypothetical protein